MDALRPIEPAEVRAPQRATGFRGLSFQEAQEIASPVRLRLEERPWLVAFFQTRLGKALIVSSFAAVIAVCRIPEWKEISFTVLLATAWPKGRRLLLSLAGVAFVLGSPGFSRGAVQGILHSAGLSWDLRFKAVLLGAVFAVIWVLKRLTIRTGLRRPILMLLVFHAALIAFSAALPATRMQMFAWGFVAVFGHYLWFTAYTLSETKQWHIPFFTEFGRYTPVWGGTSTPYAKGEAYLRSIEAQSPEALAVTQLKGLKLIVWGASAHLTNLILESILHGAHSPGEALPWLPRLAIPFLYDAIVAAPWLTPLTWATRWCSCLAFFFTSLLQITAMGHIIVGICRMLGFRALRNTYRPLAATSLADFWNRYYHYYKELLAQFFFFPAYLRYFRKWPRLRLAFATASACLVGNWLYHYLADAALIRTLGPMRAAQAYGAFAVYCLLLTAGVFASQLRNRGLRNEPSHEWGVFLRRAGVVAFFCVIAVFDQGPLVDGLTLAGEVRFAESLFTPWR